MAGMSPRMKAKKGRFGPGGLAPTVNITAPLDGASFAFGAAIDFAGEAYDDLNGDVSAQIVWTNDYDAQTFTGATGQFTFTDNGSGPTSIVVTATYSDGTNTATDTVTINVA